METKLGTSATVKEWIEDFLELQFDGVNLFCTVCDLNLSYKQKQHITGHVACNTHTNLKNGDKRRQFNMDLLKFMMGCNIPLSQLDNPIFRKFIVNCMGGIYGNVEIPGRTTLRQEYLPQVAKDVISSITSELKNKYIWLSVDETTDGSASKICNVLVGALEQCATREYLLASKLLDDVNSETVSTLVDDSLRLLWSNDYEGNKFLLFLTNDAAYMKVNLHRVAETVKECYRVDRLISSVQKVFTKAPERVELFSEFYPDTELPPEPVQKRLGSPNSEMKPGKKPLSCMSSTITTDKNGDVNMVVGASGGIRIASTVAQVIMRALWFGDNIKETVDAPRIHHQLYPMELEYEYGTLQQVVDGLTALGHKVTRNAGSIVCVLLKEANKIIGNVDYRKGGEVYGLM